MDIFVNIFDELILPYSGNALFSFSNQTLSADTSQLTLTELSSSLHLIYRRYALRILTVETKEREKIKLHTALAFKKKIRCEILLSLLHVSKVFWTMFNFHIFNAKSISIG